MEALLSYWLLQFVLSSGLEDKINAYLCHMAIHLAKWEFLLVTLYIRSLYVRLD